MSRETTVSIVLLSYNRSEVIARTIESILSQTYRHFELIICDDASSDNAVDVARRYAAGDNRIRVIENDKNRGMPGNLTRALGFAQNELIAILHDGDIYDPRLLERWSAALRECPKAGFVFNAYRVIDSEGRELGVFRERLTRCTQGSDIIERLFFRRWRFDSPVWGTVMVRRSALAEVGGFDEQYGFVADVDLWLRIAERFAVAYVAEAVISLSSTCRQFQTDSGEARRRVRQIFWKARMRHFRHNMLRLLIEGCRHFLFVCASELYIGLLKARRGMLKISGAVTCGC